MTQRTRQQSQPQTERKKTPQTTPADTLARLEKRLERICSSTTRRPRKKKNERKTGIAWKRRKKGGTLASTGTMQPYCPSSGQRQAGKAVSPHGRSGNLKPKSFPSARLFFFLFASNVGGPTVAFAVAVSQTPSPIHPAPAGHSHKPRDVAKRTAAQPTAYHHHMGC